MFRTLLIRFPNIARSRISTGVRVISAVNKFPVVNFQTKRFFSTPIDPNLNTPSSHNNPNDPNTTTPPQSTSSQEINNNNEDKTISTKVILDDDFYDDYQGSEKSQHAWNVFYVAGLSALGGLSVYALYTFLTEVFGRDAPSNLFDETFERIRVSDDVMVITGDPMRAYGMDSGRHSEGRRNHVASRKYVAQDNSKRTRIRFTVEGPYGKALVFAEISNLANQHEFVYLILQDMRTGRVLTIEDRRAELAARTMDSKEGNNSLSTLLGNPFSNSAKSV